MEILLPQVYITPTTHILLRTVEYFPKNVANLQSEVDPSEESTTGWGWRQKNDFFILVKINAYRFTEKLN